MFGVWSLRFDVLGVCLRFGVGVWFGLGFGLGLVFY